MRSLFNVSPHRGFAKIAKKKAHQKLSAARAQFERFQSEAVSAYERAHEARKACELAPEDTFLRAVCDRAEKTLETAKKNADEAQKSMRALEDAVRRLTGT